MIHKKSPGGIGGTPKAKHAVKQHVQNVVKARGPPDASPKDAAANRPQMVRKTSI
jgi:hypothetical protein